MHQRLKESGGFDNQPNLTSRTLGPNCFTHGFQLSGDIGMRFNDVVTLLNILVHVKQGIGFLEWLTLGRFSATGTITQDEFPFS